MYLLSYLFSLLFSLCSRLSSLVSQVGGGGGGRIFPEHPSPILHAPRDIISRKSKSLTAINSDWAAKYLPDKLWTVVDHLWTIYV